MMIGREAVRVKISQRFGAPLLVLIYDGPGYTSQQACEEPIPSCLLVVFSSIDTLLFHPGDKRRKREVVPSLVFEPNRGACARTG